MAVQAPNVPGRWVRLLQGARGLAMPIGWEDPFGLVMAEWLARGTPVIATRRGDAPGVIVDGVSGNEAAIAGAGGRTAAGRR